MKLDNPFEIALDNQLRDIATELEATGRWPPREALAIAKKELLASITKQLNEAHHDAST